MNELNELNEYRRRENQRMAQIKMFIHFRLTQHVSGHHYAHRQETD